MNDDLLLSVLHVVYGDWFRHENLRPCGCGWCRPRSRGHWNQADGAASRFGARSCSGKRVCQRSSRIICECHPTASLKCSNFGLIPSTTAS